MEPLDEWVADLHERSATTIFRVISAWGARVENLGPRSDFARVRLTLKPSSRLIWSMAKSLSGIEAIAFGRSALLGATDVLLTHRAYPILGVEVCVDVIETDPISSSESAFRFAGRRAAITALDELKSAISTPDTPKSID